MTFRPWLFKEEKDKEKLNFPISHSSAARRPIHINTIYKYLDQH